MTGQTGSKSPGRRESDDKVPELPRVLCGAAKRSPGRRFHGLMDRICGVTSSRRRGRECGRIEELRVSMQ